jgi:hypothetical protein
MSLRQVLKRRFIHSGANIINRSSETTISTLSAFFLPFPCVHSPDHLRPQKDRSIYCISCIWCGSTGSHWGKLRCSLRSCVFESSFCCIHTRSVSNIVLEWGRGRVTGREGKGGGRLTLQHFHFLKSIFFFSGMIFLRVIGVVATIGFEVVDCSLLSGWYAKVVAERWCNINPRRNVFDERWRSLLLWSVELRCSEEEQIHQRKMENA